jgi:general secretion pathway protein G
MKTRKTGFTLVEILIVVIILGILAAIVIPQFTEASNDARESSLVSNLQTLRSQFELYKVQHLDVYPWDDGSGALDLNNGAIIARLIGRTDTDGTLNAAGDLGPYMQEVPQNPFMSNATAQFGAAAGAGDDWVVDIAVGAITDGR